MPETKEILPKLIRCSCGFEPEYSNRLVSSVRAHFFFCPLCLMRSRCTETKREAAIAWNNIACAGEALGVCRSLHNYETSAQKKAHDLMEKFVVPDPEPAERVCAFGEYGVYTPYETHDGKVSWTVQRFNILTDSKTDMGEIIAEFQERGLAEFFAQSLFEDEQQELIHKAADKHDPEPLPIAAD